MHQAKSKRPVGTVHNTQDVGKKDCGCCNEAHKIQSAFSREPAEPWPPAGCHTTVVRFECSLGLQGLCPIFQVGRVAGTWVAVGRRLRLSVCKLIAARAVLGPACRPSEGVMQPGERFYPNMGVAGLCIGFQRFASLEPPSRTLGHEKLHGSVAYDRARTDRDLRSVRRLIPVRLKQHFPPVRGIYLGQCGAAGISPWYRPCTCGGAHEGGIVVAQARYSGKAAMPWALNYC